MIRSHSRRYAPAAFLSFLGLIVGLAAPPRAAADIIQVDPATVVTTTLIDFNGISGTENPGLNVNTILVQPGVRFGERFAGQTLGSVPESGGGPHDTLSGIPTGPLNLLAGATNQNLDVFSSIIVDPILDGIGPNGYPNFSGIGEGAISFLFDADVQEFRVSLEGANGGTASLQFF